MRIEIDTHNKTLSIWTGAFCIENAAWDPSKHPRKPYNPGKGEFVKKGTGVTASSSDVAADGTELNTVDISGSFAKVKCDPNNKQECVEKYIGGLLGQLMETATSPLKIQFGENEKAHIIRSNKDLSPTQKRRHNAALLELNKIITACKRIKKDGSVKTDHNTRKSTIQRKQNVAEYVYFRAKLKADKDLYYSIELATERYKQGPEDVYTLYNVHVKRI